MDWHAFALVLSGAIRTRVLLALDQPLMPGDLRKQLKRSYSQVSDVLAFLRAHGLVTCLNDAASKGRLYQRTAEGEAVAMELRLLHDVNPLKDSQVSETPGGRLNNV